MAYRQILLPTQHPVQQASGALCLEVKHPQREAYHLSQTSAEVRNIWTSSPTPHYIFMAYCVICLAQGQLCLTLL